MDVSVILNIHRESALLRPTIRSLVDCVLHAKETCGISVELVAVFDRSDEATKKVFRAEDLDVFNEVSVLDTDFGLLSPSRNAGAQAAHGTYVWLADADDLVSINALTETWRRIAQAVDEAVVLVPEFVVSFGARAEVARYAGSENLTPADFAWHHPYTSRLFLSRKALIQYPLSHVELDKGYAFEDWDLSNRLFAGGFTFEAVPKTVLFYRRKEDGVLATANRLAQGLPPYSPLFEPDRFMTEQLKIEASNGSKFQFTREREASRSLGLMITPDENELLQSSIRAAHAIEPAIKSGAYDFSRKIYYFNVPGDLDHWGAQLAAFFALATNQSVTDVFILADTSPGGEGEFFQQGEVLLSTEPTKPFIPLALTGFEVSGASRESVLGAYTPLIDLCTSFPTLAPSDRLAMAVRGITALAGPGAVIHLEQSPFAEALIEQYGRILSNHFVISSSALNPIASTKYSVPVGEVVDHRTRELATHIERLGGELIERGGMSAQAAQRELNDILGSRSWRLAAPLRWAGKVGRLLAGARLRALVRRVMPRRTKP